MVLFQALYNLLWGDLVTIPLPGGSSLGLSLLVLILVPAGLYFTVRTRFLPFRLFPEMFRVTMEKNTSSREGISGLQALIVSTACRVGMGNLVGVVAAISAGGGLGAVITNGAKRGLFSNEAGSGSAPCAAAAAHISHPAKAGLVQALGVFIDTIVICSCSAMIMLLTPRTLTDGLEGMDLLQTAMQYHLGEFGAVFIAVILWLFSFSTFLGVLFYARSNVAYLFGDNWLSQTLYKVVALAMLFVGGLAAYQFVWDLGDVGIGLMTVFNMIALVPLAPKALAALKDYEKNVLPK